MRKVAYLFIFIFCTCLPGFSQANFDARFKAKETVFLLRHGKFETIYNRMDPLMKRMMDEEKLMGFWDVLEMSNGQIISVAEPSITSKDKLIISITPIEYERKKIGLKVVFNAKGEICGLFVAAPNPQYQHPDYINPYSFYEYKKTLARPNFPLSGILTVPKKGIPFPLVIIVGDAGNTDKDLSIGSSKMYKDLAWGLADNGVAVFRYDRRRFSYPKEMAAQKNASLKEEYLNDLQFILQQLKTVHEIDSNHIFILGHGLGGYLLPYFEKNLKGVQGYIGFSAPYSTYPELLLAQAKYLQAKAPAVEKVYYEAQVKKAQNAVNPLLVKSKLDSFPDGFSSSLLASLNENSPAKIGSNLLAKRVLFIQGGRDFEVPPAELESWKSAAGTTSTQNWTFINYPKLNHIGIEGEGVSLPSEYEKPGNVPLDILLQIASFVLY
ncbi:MAG: hypothetical protein CFE21_01475 [Bacteroidetes bacterium B1(2017)]|nr:MAG: hypothetical protein CFE21_01475 [Bacteroidetes bacterium B1(2017)]